MPSLSKPILIWAVPRSCSSAFTRAFTQREDAICLHEPFSEPFYYGPERLSPRFSDDDLKDHEHKDKTYDGIINTIQSAQRSGKNVIVKDMAYYVLNPNSEPPSGGNPTVLSDDVLRGFTHTFLIRTPEKSIASYYRTQSSGNCGIFEKFEVSEAGFKEMKILYEYIAKNIHPGSTPPVIIDAEDLVPRPEATLRAYCKSVGLKFDPAMLSWEKKEVFAGWTGFHDVVHNSTGFTEIKRNTSTKEFPKVVQDAIRDNLPLYEWLKERKLKF